MRHLLGRRSHSIATLSQLRSIQKCNPVLSLRARTGGVAGPWLRLCVGAASSHWGSDRSVPLRGDARAGEHPIPTSETSGADEDQRCPARVSGCCIGPRIRKSSRRGTGACGLEPGHLGREELVPALRASGTPARQRMGTFAEPNPKPKGTGEAWRKHHTPALGSTAWCRTPTPRPIGSPSADVP